ncbi:MAG: AbrB/MazE/SpoVT family DNA-binding domain-containing protein [Micrococcales bacterium]|nr:AbrB/MazE/SpoVT family DNA-binding domain-containing protein [Micrococcales bacterium]
MTTLQITAKGQITLKKAVLEALGAKPGDKVDVEPALGGGVTLRPVRKTGSFADVYCRHSGSVSEPVSIEEMNEVIAAGWAGEL